MDIRTSLHNWLDAELSKLHRSLDAVVDLHSHAAPLNVSAFTVAQRFTGIQEIPGKRSNPQILAMLRLDDEWPEDDAVPWCSAFLNYVMWILDLPRSRSLRARSWLNVGRPIPLHLAQVGFDVVILSRGSGTQPGPDVIDAPGHVGLYAGVEGEKILILGGNQGDSVNIGRYPRERLLGVRRVREAA